jgi:hypothetical protein
MAESINVVVVEKVVKLNSVVNDAIENGAHKKVEDVYDVRMSVVSNVVVCLLNSVLR